MQELIIMLRNVIVFVLLAIPGYILIKTKILKIDFNVFIFYLSFLGIQQVMDGTDLFAALAVDPGDTAADAANKFVIEAVRRCGDLLHGDDLVTVPAY